MKLQMKTEKRGVGGQERKRCVIFLCEIQHREISVHFKLNPGVPLGEPDRADDSSLPETQ